MLNSDNSEIKSGTAYVLFWFDEENERNVISVYTSREQAELGLAKAYMKESDDSDGGYVYTMFGVDEAPLYLDVPNST